MAEVKMNKKKKLAVVKNAGDVSINTVDTLKKAILEGFSGAQRVEMDLSAATGVDVAVLQLFCASHRYSREQGKEFALQQPLPDALRVVIRESGFFRHAGCKADDGDTCIWIMEEEQ